MFILSYRGFCGVYCIIYFNIRENIINRYGGGIVYRMKNETTTTTVKGFSRDREFLHSLRRESKRYHFKN
jgi:hypothetical protein